MFHYIKVFVIKGTKIKKLYVQIKCYMYEHCEINK